MDSFQIEKSFQYEMLIMQHAQIKELQSKLFTMSYIKRLWICQEI